MLVRLETADDVRRERITQLLRYSINGHSEDIDNLQLNVETMRDPLGTELHRCRLRALLRHGPPIEVEEVQSRLDLTVTRALERCVRTIQRRRRASMQRHFA